MMIVREIHYSKGEEIDLKVAEKHNKFFIRRNKGGREPQGREVYTTAGGRTNS